jgi:N-acetylneuraminic acid mutarotase
MRSKCISKFVAWFALVFVTGLASGALAQVTGTWTRAAPFPEASEELYAIVVNEKMYVFGGYGNRAPKGMVYEYDPKADTWDRKKNMILPAHHTALATLNGKIYVFGGYAASKTRVAGWLPIDNTWEYDPLADTWKALAPLPHARGSAMAFEHKGKIYVIGGNGMHPGVAPATLWSNLPQRSYADVDEYDPATNTWRARSPMPTPRNHMFGGIVDGKIYIIGGRLGPSFIGAATNVDIVEVFDPDTNAWGAPQPRMPTARSGGGSAVHSGSGRIFVAGGEQQDHRMFAAFRAFEVFDTRTRTWSVLPEMPTPRHGFASVFIGNRFHVVSGEIQAAGTGVPAATPSHDVFEVK